MRIDRYHHSPVLIRMLCRLFRSAASCVQRETGSEKLPGINSGNKESRASTAACIQ